jgi:hypothetical protein
MTLKAKKHRKPEVVVGVALRNDEGEVWSSRKFLLHSDLFELVTTGTTFEAGFETNLRPFVDRETAYALQFPRRRAQGRMLHMTHLIDAARRRRRTKNV